MSTKKEHQAKSLFQRIVLWLAMGMAVLSLLVVAVALLAEKFLNNPDIKGRIQLEAATAAGITLDYQRIGISYYPLPVIELQGLTFALPEQVDGVVGSVRIVVDLAGLLSGKFTAGRIELVRPDVSIILKNQQVAVQSTGANNKEKNRSARLAGLGMAGSELVISDGRFALQSGDIQLEGEGLALTLQLSLAGVHQATAGITTTLARLAIAKGSQRQSFEQIGCIGSGTMQDGGMAIRLEELTVARPALGLSGSLKRTDKGVQLDLVGKNIDVDATRAAALGMAGTITPIPEIFTYLTGGIVPQIHFVAEGVNFGDLGEYANFHLDGQLREGKVAVPEIGLDLSEVAGEIHLVDGVLRGDNLSARLGATTGSSGTLALGLTKESDLFQLQLMVKADLAEGKTIVKRLVNTLQFSKALDRITLLEGTSTGKLMLGDSFSDLGVQVDDADLQLSFSHTALPYPVRINGGRLDFVKDNVTLQDLNGTFGGSVVSGLTCLLDWQKGLQLDLSLKESQLALNELFPWLKKMEGVKSQLAAVTSASGKIHLNEAHFKGAIDQSTTWKYGAAGDVTDGVVVVPAFPEKITLARSTFTLDDRTLTLQKTDIAALDGDLQLQGTVRDWSTVDLGVDGTLGPKSVAWLQSILDVEEKYGIRPPVSIGKARLGWKKNGESRFSGNVTFGTGPVLALVVEKDQKGLNIEQLKVKGIGTDLAELKLFSDVKGIDAGFNGMLGHETLEALFVHPLAGKGFLEGDIGVKIPAAEGRVTTAHGRLNGSRLLVPLNGDETLAIGKIAIQAEGSAFRAEIGDLLWHDYLFKRVSGTVDVQRDTISAIVEQADLCNIPVTGRVRYGDDTFELAVELNEHNLDVATTYTCLTRGMGKMTGTMGASGQVTTNGTSQQLVSNLEGPLEMTFTNGIILQGRMMAAILEVLNVTEVVKGRLPSLSTSGLSYNTITMQGRFGEGKFHLDKIYMDGETLDLVGSGSIDLEQNTLHIELLAAPFKTVDSVIKYIPGINYLLGGSLIAIPLSVSGTLAKPKVVVISASSVSKSLLNLGSRTLNLPLHLLQSILPGSK